MSLVLTYEACVRTRSRELDCQKCVEACPTNAITVGDDNSIRVALDDCVDCGQCRPSCPTEVFSAPFDLQAVLTETDGILRCGDGGLPCIAALSTEDLITLGFRVDAISLQGACPHGHAPVAQRLDEAERVLHTLGRPTTLSFEDNLAVETGKGASRREFFSALRNRKTGKEITRTGRFNRDAMRRTPPQRKRLLAALKGAQITEPIEGDLSFSSSKYLDPKICTICTICVNVCPTNALQPTHGWQALNFDASLCVRCGLCHAVCAPDALQLRPAKLEPFIAPKPQRLARLRITTCVECGRAYNPTAHGMLCAPCAEMEAEAFDLTGINR